MQTSLEFYLFVWWFSSNKPTSTITEYVYEKPPPPPVSNSGALTITAVLPRPFTFDLHNCFVGSFLRHSFDTFEPYVHVSVERGFFEKYFYLTVVDASVGLHS